MPKLSSRVPRSRLHKGTGQAVVRLHGRDIYLGKQGSAASNEAYKRFVAEWSESGGKLLGSPHASTVTELVIAYTTFAVTYYQKDGKPTNEVRMIKSAIKIARQLYGRTPSTKFGPLALKSCRGRMIEKDWCRSHSYGRAIRRAAEKAGVGAWSPHRLRHTFATEVRKTFGLEAVQVCLGHSKATVSEIYAERDFAKAANVARQIG